MELKLNKKLLAVALLSTFVAAPAIAADSAAYVGLDYSMLTLTNVSAGVSQPDGGFRIVGGYNFSPMLAAEVGYSMDGSGKTAAAKKYTPHTTYVAAVGSYPLNDTFSLIGKLGYAMNELTGDATTGCTTCTNSGLMYGAGAQYNISKQVGVRLQYEVVGDYNKPATGSAIGGSAINLGAIFNF